MDRVYEFATDKKGEVTKLLEADPYAADSFARVGYRIRDGASLSEDKTKMYIYISAADDFIKKADERLKALATPLKADKEKEIVAKIKAEEEAAESGLGSLFG